MKAKKPKRRAKVVPLVKAVAAAVVERVPPTWVAPALSDEPLGRWARFHLWVGLLPSRVRHAAADAFAQSKEPL